MTVARAIGDDDVLALLSSAALESRGWARLVHDPADLGQGGLRVTADGNVVFFRALVRVPLLRGFVESWIVDHEAEGLMTLALMAFSESEADLAALDAAAAGGPLSVEERRSLMILWTARGESVDFDTVDRELRLRVPGL